MPDTPSLKKLLDLAQKQSDDSAKNLGRLNYQHLEAERKLNLLLQYRQSYQDRLQNAIQSGIGHVEWQNFITFINKLDNAISEQRLAVEYTENNRKIGNDEYLSCQRKLNTYTTLVQRHQESENIRQNKIEQKILDEFTSNRLARNNSNANK
ncbi:flagellar export protein FliJ [Nitrosomonas sp.]|uniref:flagellar export protein FliJ n=1 Tax=Nitrosomonas sp. TaxID=42353 RepID=UPI001D60F453|nr:flagellar export protein FliJ [Nitrosomonas sp.]MCB1948345.1 flagellar export protein FliJ [Nitrosomonas sp.]MCP5244187.1 flagellar export protein FliJ [Burkholderiales bacterium]MDR4515239.1 flagellar export protein FliJ [Nitrosomonas sp.]